LTFHETVSGISSRPEHWLEVKYHIESKSDILKILFATDGKLPDCIKLWEIKWIGNLVFLGKK